jgi:hypothetical protein
LKALKTIIVLQVGKIKFNVNCTFKWGAHGGTAVEALRYNPEGRRIDSRWCHWNFSLT